MNNRPVVLLEDVEAALQQTRKVMDITPEDLLTIVDLTLDQAEKRQSTFEGKQWIGEIMTVPVITCTPDTTIEEAARILLEKNIHCLPVVDRENKLVGIVTESDLIFQFSAVPVGGTLRQLLGRKKAPRTGHTIGEIMVRKVTTVYPNDPIQKAIRLIIKHGFGRIPVVDENNRVVGIVARKDILHFLK
ncbi:CBS domain-containing protein [Desulfofundulus thermosubterraneus]|uniref:CBS domain-containing protein n=1 Tax=Desulfofundulus thermosubterraneus DSM 16057 TaxID=1121432 RepID=A0A1M6AIA7_9FIRM|nr:CBS domain-containing protein [Desulfofundulus thermosubterraneus]SHI36192.1 CBS domain-containing protein [Desulfofundulus thermosubterraneus DSM 16057]